MQGLAGLTYASWCGMHWLPRQEDINEVESTSLSYCKPLFHFPEPLANQQISE
jgi:hypothetical protein